MINIKSVSEISHMIDIVAFHLNGRRIDAALEFAQKVIDDIDALKEEQAFSAEWFADEKVSAMDEKQGYGIELLKELFRRDRKITDLDKSQILFCITHINSMPTGAAATLFSIMNGEIIYGKNLNE